MSSSTRSQAQAAPGIHLDSTVTFVLFIFAVFAVLAAVGYYKFKNPDKFPNPKFPGGGNSNPKHMQQSTPYVAKVNLADRYGGLQKRSVRPEDLDEETLRLLIRDGKLNNATIERLKEMGKLT